MRSAAARLRSRLALALATAALFVAIWTVLPPPTYALLVVAVAAPEIGVWLACAALIAAALAFPGLGRDRSARLALALALLVLALAAPPLLRFHVVAREFDDAMRGALGNAAPEQVPDAVRHDMHAAPLSVVQLFFGLPPEEARITRALPFATSDGATLSLDVYQPAADGIFPVLVQIYGGAWQRGAPGDNERFARYFAAHGYVVFAIDYRHAPQWQWPTQLQDTQAALTWIATHARDYGADTTRLALIGRSSGAELALVAAYTEKIKAVRAVVSIYGPIDLAASYREPPRPDPLQVRAVAEAYLGGTPDQQPERYAEASPITYATHSQPPTLLVYGGRDNVVEARFGALLDERLRGSGNVSVLLVIPWAQHAFDLISGGPSAQLALYHTERFLAWALNAR